MIRLRLSTPDDVAKAIAIALQISGLGLRPVNQSGGVVRLGVFRHSVNTAGTPRLSSRVVAATQDEVAGRLADSILTSGLGLTPTNVGLGLIRLGSTTHQVNVSGAPRLQFQLVPGSQDEVADQIVLAIRNTNLAATPVNLGAGEVFLGRQVTNLDTTAAPTLTKFGSGSGQRHGNGGCLRASTVPSWSRTTFRRRLTVPVWASPRPPTKVS